MGPKRGLVCYASKSCCYWEFRVHRPSLLLALLSHRRELGILFVSPQPLLKPATEEMYSHLQAHHPESLEIGERDWKMELFGMGPFRNQQQ